jgi:beta-galactosidase
MVPRAHDRITFTVDGPARIVATDNGDPTSMEAFGSPARDAFNGLALAILRANHDASGTIRITAAGEGLRSGTAVVRVTR